MSVFGVTAKSGGGNLDFEIPPAGSHVAVLVALIDLGTQVEEYQGQQKKARRVHLVWELTDERHPKFERNFTIGKDFAISFNNKASLRKLVESWRGSAFKEDEAFDLAKLLGQPCILTVTHKVSGSGNTYAKVDAATPLMKSMPRPTASLPLVLWSIDGGEPIPAHEWIPYIVGKPVKEVIARSPEYQGGGNAQQEPTPQEESIPF